MTLGGKHMSQDKALYPLCARSGPETGSNQCSARGCATQAGVAETYSRYLV